MSLSRGAGKIFANACSRKFAFLSIAADATVMHQLASETTLYTHHELA